MNCGPRASPLIAAAALAGAAVVWPASIWQKRLDRNLSASTQAALATDPSTECSQKIKELPDAYSAEYGFENFNKDRITVNLQVKKSVFEADDARWGYSTKAVNDLKSWQNNERKKALPEAEASGKSQKQLDAALADIKKEFKQKLKDYLASRGFLLYPDDTVEVDMPGLVRRNAPRVRALVEDLDRFAKKKRYGSEEIVGAAASLVQTAILYKVPPTAVGDVRTGGVWPPVTTLINGWGDCITKTGTLASILTNYSGVRMVGISVPEHYLAGILRIPGKRDAYVEYQGADYVLIEAAGPAWLPPGTVASTTQVLLDGSAGYKIEPFF